MEAIDAVRNKDGIFINTQCFREEAMHFKKYGRYTDGLPGTLEYDEYWEEQERRLINGYESGGVKITGEMYGYLNFSQIKLSVDKQLLREVNPRINNSTARHKKRDFPMFMDGDYNYFHGMEIARHGTTKEELNNLQLDFTPLFLEGGRHLCVGKARRKGYSYKAGYVVAHRYKTEAESISVLAAFDWKYLTSADATMTMARNCIDFYNEHTAFSRGKIINTKAHQKDGVIENINGVQIEKGYKSQIISVSCGDNPDAIRGKDGTLVFIEEAGKFPNLIDTLHSTLPTLEDGKFVTGLMVVFGTGGGDNTNWEGFEEVFYDPETYRMLPIMNIWDENAENTSCGFFHPDYVSKIGYLDLNGNSLKEKAKKEEEIKREEIAKSSRDGTALTKHKMEFPFSPSEAFSRSSSNNFPVEELNAHYNNLIATKNYKGITGNFKRNAEGEVEFELDLKANPIIKYPHKDITDLQGCVIKYQEPYKIKGSIPDGLHIICHDPYAFDDSIDGTSLGATYVIRQNNRLGVRGDIIVASYIGKPESQDDYNKTLFYLAEYYNAKIGFENDRGNTIDYCKRNRHLFKWLEPEFELGFDDKINNSLNRSYGMSMSGGKDNRKKKQGDIFIRDWLLTERSVTEDGKIIKNLHLIKDLALLQELCKYNPTKGNYDRISALRVGMYYLKELEYNQATKSQTKKESSKSKFFKMKLYG